MHERRDIAQPSADNTPIDTTQLMLDSVDPPYTAVAAKSRPAEAELLEPATRDVTVRL
jgi:hypothetical protein